MDLITEPEKEEFQNFISAIYGPQAMSWEINLKVSEIFGELIQSSDTCSRYMDTVPRPFIAGSAIKWGSKQARNAVIRHLKNGGKHYLICLRATGLSRRTDIEMASKGF